MERLEKHAPRLAACALAVAFVAAPATARAQEGADILSSTGDAPGISGGLDQAQKRPYWGYSGHARPFVSSVFEVGIFYLRPSLAVGWGKPHWSWIGVEGYTNLSPGGGAEYAGVRAASQYVDLRVGARYAFPAAQYFLPEEVSYTRDETEYKLGARSRYVAGEAELSGAVPAPFGSLFGVATGYVITGVPEGYAVYEEALHAVVEPPFVWRGRLGYLAAVGKEADMKVGLAGELIGSPARGTVVTRAGPVIGILLTHHLEAVGSLMIVLAGPDDLGLVGAELGALGLRYRWATGDRWPDFP